MSEVGKKELRVQVNSALLEEFNKGHPVSGAFTRILEDGLQKELQTLPPSVGTAPIQEAIVALEKRLAFSSQDRESFAFLRFLLTQNRDFGSFEQRTINLLREANGLRALRAEEMRELSKGATG